MRRAGAAAEGGSAPRLRRPPGYFRAEEGLAVLLLACWGAAATADIRFATADETLELLPIDVAEARAVDGDAPAVAFRLTETAARTFGAFTGRSVDEEMTFAICGETLLKVVLRIPIRGGRARIAVKSDEEAERYAAILRGDGTCPK